MSLLGDASKARAAMLANEHIAEQGIRDSYRRMLAHIKPAITGFMLGMQDAGAGNVRWLHENNRLHNFIAQVVASQIAFKVTTQQSIERGAGAAINLGHDAAHTAILSLVPHHITWPVKTARERAAGHALTSTARTSAFLDRIGATTANTLRSVITEAVINGVGPRQAATAIQDVFDSAQSYALMVSRTEILSAYRGAQLANFQANADILDGWVWLCALSMRSCAFCVSMHGTFHSLDESMETHPNCSCTQVPHSRSWADLLADAGVAGAGDIPDTNPSIASGESWFNGLSADAQRQMLGPAKYNALAAGDIQFSDLAGDGAEASLKSLGLDASDYLDGGDV